MKTNLLSVTSVPSIVYSSEFNLSYLQAIQFFKAKPIYFHLSRNTLYFLGDPDLVGSTLETLDMASAIDEAKVDQDFIKTNWPVFRVLIYKVFRHFLYMKGFRFHSKFKNRAFMVKERRYGWRTLIYDYSEQNKPAFVHEGFNFFLRLYNDEVFLGLNPCVTVTRDGVNCISPKDLSYNKFMEFKTYFVDRRYNSKIREMFNIFVDMLCGEIGKIIVPTFSGNIEIDGNAVELG